MGIGIGVPGCQRFELICCEQAVEILGLSYCTLSLSMSLVFLTFIVSESKIFSLPPKSTAMRHVLVIRASGFLDLYSVCICQMERSVSLYR